jgi:hypothetical protein
MESWKDPSRAVRFADPVQFMDGANSCVTRVSCGPVQVAF